MPGHRCRDNPLRAAADQGLPGTMYVDTDKHDGGSDKNKWKRLAEKRSRVRGEKKSSTRPHPTSVNDEENDVVHPRPPESYAQLAAAAIGIHLWSVSKDITSIDEIPSRRRGPRGAIQHIQGQRKSRRIGDRVTRGVAPPPPPPPQESAPLAEPEESGVDKMAAKPKPPRPEKRIKCSVGGCEHRVVYPSELKKHMVTKHTGEKPLKCPFPECGYACIWLGGCELPTGASQYVGHTDAARQGKPFVPASTQPERLFF